MGWFMNRNRIIGRFWTHDLSQKALERRTMNTKVVIPWTGMKLLYLECRLLCSETKRGVPKDVY